MTFNRKEKLPEMFPNSAQSWVREAQPRQLLRTLEVVSEQKQPRGKQPRGKPPGPCSWTTDVARSSEHLPTPPCPFRKKPWIRSALPAQCQKKCPAFKMLYFPLHQVIFFFLQVLFILTWKGRIQIKPKGSVYVISTFKAPTPTMDHSFMTLSE